MKKLFFILILLLIYFACSEKKITEPSLFTVSGIIEFDNVNESSISILLIYDDTLETKASPEGSFTFENVPEGEYSLHIENISYVPYDTVFTITEDIFISIKLERYPDIRIPDAPTDFNIQSISDTELEISWKDNCDFEKGFNVYRTNSSGNYELIEILDDNTTSWIDKDKNNSEAPFYRITAFTDLKESEISESFAARWQYFEILNKLNVGPILKAQYNYTNELIVAQNNSNIKIINALDLNILADIEIEDPVSTFEMSKQNNYIFCGSELGNIFIYDINNYSLIEKINLHENRVAQIAVSSDNNLMLSSDTLKIVLYHIGNQSILNEWPLDNFKIRDLEFGHNSDRILFAKQNGFDKTIEQWDLNTLTITNNYSFSQFGGLEIEFSNNDQIISVASGMVMDGVSFLLSSVDFIKYNNFYHHSICSRFNGSDELLLSCFRDDNNPAVQFYLVSDLIGEERKFFVDRIFTSNNLWLDISSNNDFFIICGYEGIHLYGLFQNKRWVKILP